MAKVNRALRPFFAVSGGECVFHEEDISFDWHSGMSWQVRQRSSDALASAIVEAYGARGVRRCDILEVSTASHDYEVGQRLSAMNLQYVDEGTNRVQSVENWFQSAKVFRRADGRLCGPYRDLLDLPAGSRAKRYVDAHLDAKLRAAYCDDELFNRIQDDIAGATFSHFEFLGEAFPTVPRSCFYDFLYVSALSQPQNADLAERVMEYRVFTDIMFSPGTGKRRKYNTQARSCAIFVGLRRRGCDTARIGGIEEFVEAVGYPDSETSDGRPRTLFE